MIDEGLTKCPLSTVLLLCSGEVHVLCGDVILALQNFHKVTLMDPTNPMPWLNAARTYYKSLL